MGVKTAAVTWPYSRIVVMSSQPGQPARLECNGNRAIGVMYSPRGGFSHNSCRPAACFRACACVSTSRGVPCAMRATVRSTKISNCRAARITGVRRRADGYGIRKGRRSVRVHCSPAARAREARRPLTCQRNAHLLLSAACTPACTPRQIAGSPNWE
eukprot:scaffold16116_cov111-Isochrysis_galbana.AAC.1